MNRSWLKFSSSALVVLMIASALLLMEWRRREALDILESARSNCEDWRNLMGVEVGGKLAIAEGRKKWLTYPRVVVAGDTGGSVSAARLGDAVAALKPSLLIIQIEYAMDMHCAERIGSVQRLETLWFDTSWNVADEHVAVLRGHPNLKDLALDHSKVTAASFDVFASMPRLEVVRLNDTTISEDEKEQLRKRLPKLAVF